MIFPRSEVPDRNDIVIDFDTVDLYLIDIKEARKATKASASNRLVHRKASVFHAEMGINITFNNSGIKECINQPFFNQVAKLVLIRDGLEDALRNAKYYHDPEPPHKDKMSHVVRFHYLEYELDARLIYFNIQETVKGEYILYSITDARKKRT